MLHHLEECGLDGFFMLQDIQGTYNNIITYHAMFPLQEIKWQTSATFMGPMDKQNLDWSERFLMNSLDMTF